MKLSRISPCSRGGAPDEVRRRRIQVRLLGLQQVPDSRGAAIAAGRSSLQTVRAVEDVANGRARAAISLAIRQPNWRTHRRPRHPPKLRRRETRAVRALRRHVPDVEEVRATPVSFYQHAAPSIDARTAASYEWRAAEWRAANRRSAASSSRGAAPRHQSPHVHRPPRRSAHRAPRRPHRVPRCRRPDGENQLARADYTHAGEPRWR